MAEDQNCMYRGSPYQPRRPSRGAYNKDPLYYHAQYHFEEFRYETEKAYLLLIQGKEVWIPKSIVEKFNLEGLTFFGHKSTMFSILSKSRDPEIEF
jgi:hypothetical protein